MKDNFGDEVPETGENVYGWWFSTSNRIFHIIKSDTLVGFEESLDSIARVFKDDGPFDGILGFSQGASFASILCSMQQENLLPFKFDFAIFISGFKSLCSPHNKYYSAILDIPSLHIYGTNDKIIPTGEAPIKCPAIKHHSNRNNLLINIFLILVPPRDGDRSRQLI